MAIVVVSDVPGQLEMAQDLDTAPVSAEAAPVRRSSSSTNRNPFPVSSQLLCLNKMKCDQVFTPDVN